MTTEVSANPERAWGSIEAPVKMLYGNFESAERLGARFYDSKYGPAMDTQLWRFEEVFGYYPRTLMYEDLNGDVVPTQHQVGTWMQIRGMLQDEGLRERLGITTEDYGLLCFVALIHDIGESMHPDVKDAVGEVLGDIPAFRKTPENRQLETKVRRFFYGTLFADVAPEVIERAEAIISHNDTSILHEIYEAAHAVQTFETAMRAGRQVFELITSSIVLTSDERLAFARKNDRRLKQLGRLFRIVGLYNLPIVQRLAEEFEYARDVLDRWSAEAHAVSDFTVSDQEVELARVVSGLGGMQLVRSGTMGEMAYMVLRGRLPAWHS